VPSIKGKIGLREISAMPPGPFLMWDTVRRQFSNAITYSVIYRGRDGLQHWLKIGRHSVWTPTLAREEAKRVLLAVDMGKDPSAERHALRSGATIAELVDDYLADMDAHKLNGKRLAPKNQTAAGIAIHIRPRLGKFRVAAITQSQIEDFMNGCTPGSAKRIMQLLGAISHSELKRDCAVIIPARELLSQKRSEKRGDCPWPNMRN
jgi:hypothetical protein